MAKGSAELTRRAEDNLADPEGQYLRTRAQAEGVAAHHPGAVPGDLAPPHRGEAKDNRERHERTEQQPEALQQSAIVVRALVELRHPQSRQGGDESRSDQ